MKPLVLIIVLALALSGCNNLNDLRPPDPNPEIPEATVKTVKDKFPKAEELVFKPILADKIWEVKLKSDADRYTSLVDYGKMWETFKVSPDGAPAVLQESLKKTAFGDGIFTSYSTGYFAAAIPNKLIYNYKGEDYSFEWTGVSPVGANSTAAFDQILYRITTYEVSDLPASVKDTIRGTPNMTFIRGHTWVRLDDSKWYYVITTQKIGDRSEGVHLLFDDKGKLRWSSTAFTQPGLPNVPSNMETVPAEIRQYLDSRPELAGYEFERKLVNNVNGLTSYYVSLTVGGVSRCLLYFDKDFNLLNKTYVVVLY